MIFQSSQLPLITQAENEIEGGKYYYNIVSFCSYYRIQLIKVFLLPSAVPTLNGRYIPKYLCQIHSLIRCFRYIPIQFLHCSTFAMQKYLLGLLRTCEIHPQQLSIGILLHHSPLQDQIHSTRYRRTKGAATRKLVVAKYFDGFSGAWLHSVVKRPYGFQS